MDDTSIKQRIENRRKELGITQLELAVKAGIERNVYRGIAVGNTLIVNNHLESIAAALELSPVELIFGDEYLSGDASLLTDNRGKYRSSFNNYRQEQEERISSLENENQSLSNRVAELEQHISNMQDLIDYLKKERK